MNAFFLKLQRHFI